MIANDCQSTFCTVVQGHQERRIVVAGSIKDSVRRVAVLPPYTRPRLRGRVVAAAGPFGRHPQPGEARTVKRAADRGALPQSRWTARRDRRAPGFLRADCGEKSPQNTPRWWFRDSIPGTARQDRRSDEWAGGRSQGRTKAHPWLAREFASIGSHTPQREALGQGRLRSRARLRCLFSKGRGEGDRPLDRAGF